MNIVQVGNLPEWLEDIMIAAIWKILNITHIFNDISVSSTSYKRHLLYAYWYCFKKHIFYFFSSWTGIMILSY